MKLFRLLGAQDSFGLWDWRGSPGLSFSLPVGLGISYIFFIFFLIRPLNLSVNGNHGLSFGTSEIFGGYGAQSLPAFCSHGERLSFLYSHFFSWGISPGRPSDMRYCL